MLKFILITLVLISVSSAAANKDLVNQILTVDISTIGAQGEPIAIDLGYAIDITDMSGSNFVSSCFSSKTLKDLSHTEIAKPTPASSSYYHMISDTEDSMLDISGSLEMTMSVEVASVTGKAQVKSHSSSVKATRTMVLKQVIQEYTDHLDLSTVKSADLLCNKKVKFTHIVTKVVRGKRLMGTVRMTSKNSDNSLDAQGKLKVDLLNIPIGGSGKIHYHSNDIRENYDFVAELKTSGGNFVKTAMDVEDYVAGVEAWLVAARDQEDKNLKTMPISYELHPISTTVNFDDRVDFRSRKDEMLLARAKPIISDMAILSEAQKHLKTVVPLSMIGNLSKRIDDLEDRTFELSNAGIENKITLKMIKDLREHRQSNFLASEEYKVILALIRAERDTIKTGEFLLKFDKKYLTPKKALNIKISNRDITANGKDNGICDVKVCGIPMGSQIGFGATTNFTCNKNYVSNETNFYDKNITFLPADCKRIEINDSDNFNDVSIHYETNGKEAEIHFENKFQLGSFCYDCNGYHTVKPEYQQSDLPLFHIEDINSALIEDMKYHMIATEEKAFDYDYTWNVQKVAGSSEHFHIKNMAREDRKLCMYNFNGYYSVVIDKAPEDRPDCQWYKSQGILMNVYHNKCVSRAGNLPFVDAPENSIQLAGYYNNGNNICVSFVQETTIPPTEKRMLKRSDIAAAE